MNKTKVLYLDFLEIGGTTAALVNFVKYELSKINNTIEFIIVVKKGTNLENLESSTNVKIYYYTGNVPRLEFHEFASNLIRTIAEYFSVLGFVLRIAWKEKPKIIHTYHYMWGIYTNIVGFILGIQVILYMCDSWPLSKVGRKLLKINKRTIYLCVSKYIETLFTTTYKFNKDQSVMIYDSVDDSMFIPPSQKEILLKISKNHKYVIYVSRVTPLRDIEVFIETAFLLTQKFSKLKFYHWGFSKSHSDIPYYNKLNKLVKELGLTNKFFFRKHSKNQNQLTSFMKNAYLSIIPARQFALPNVAIQSMISGTPVIANNVGGNPEIIANGINGYLINYNFASLYANKIEDLLINKRKYLEFSKKGIIFAKRRFSIKVRSKKIKDLYNKILKS